MSHDKSGIYNDEATLGDGLPAPQHGSGSGSGSDSGSTESQWKEVALLLSELAANATKVAIEACFLIAWAGIVRGISEVLALIEHGMPEWAQNMFKYVEIGFAVFLLSEMFLRRADIVERAVNRAGQLLRTFMRAFSFGRK